MIMAAMAADFEGVDRASDRAAHAATIPAICNMFPTAIERRDKIFRCGSEFEVFTIPAASENRFPDVRAQRI